MNFRNLRNFYFPFILFLVFVFILLGFIYLQPLLNNNNIVKCNQKFGLCPSAQCVPNPNDDSKAYCFCDVKNGSNYSLGNNSCEKISPYKTNAHQEIIFSDFSPIIKKMGYHQITCPPETVNLNCMNKICSVYPNDPTKAICICDKTNNNGMNWVTYNKNGEPKKCNYKSGASYSNFTKLMNFINYSS